MENKSQSKDMQKNHIDNRKSRHSYSLLFVGLTLMLLAFSCTNSTTEAAVEKGTTTSALLSESNIVGGTAESVIHTDQRAATANEIVAAQETVLGNIYQTSLASVVQVKIVQRVQNEPSAFGFHFFGGGPQGLDDRFLRGEGSGFVWDADGHILTNYHVVQNADTLNVVFSDGYEVQASFVGGDPDSDLAILKIDVSDRSFIPLPKGDTADLRVGQLALAIGSPFGQDFTLTSGIVSALGRTIRSGNSPFTIPQVIQTDAPINPGNSGGPLLDRRGQVIGINTQIIARGGGGSSGIGFAVPINIAKRVVPKLIEYGAYEYSWLGISGATTTAEVVERMALPTGTRGVQVIMVGDNSPASEAGLKGSNREVTIEGLDFQLGGDVIVGINGDTIRNMEDLLAFLVANTSPGDVVTLDIIQEGGIMDSVRATLGSRPND
ncbi:MAG: trypsin-like peptidase domain-containing protein [Chloroflexota bacterium]|nr:trypsin-like peptidase domain-containing protein [Chloroflexota bacterium]